MFKKVYIILTIIFLSWCGSYVPEIREIKEKNEVWKEYVTKNPLVYNLNIPYYDELDKLAVIQSILLYSKKIDRKINNLTSSYSNSSQINRLSTPLRVTLLPTGSKLTVIDEYEYYSTYWYPLSPPTSIHYLILEDENNNKSEISKLGFKLMMESNYISNEEKMVRKHITYIQKHWYIKLYFCPMDIWDGSWKDLINDLQLENDIQLENNINIYYWSMRCKNGNLLYFKNLEAYLTSIYYYNNWSIYGTWYIKYN